MKPVIVACIIAIVILVIYTIGVYYAYSNHVLMFKSYTVQKSSEFAIYNANPKPFDSDQITARQQTAASVCSMLANMQNPVSTYCSAQPTASGISCSNI